MTSDGNDSAPPTHKEAHHDDDDFRRPVEADTRSPSSTNRAITQLGQIESRNIGTKARSHTTRERLNINPSGAGHVSRHAARNADLGSQIYAPTPHANRITKSADVSDPYGKSIPTAYGEIERIRLELAFHRGKQIAIAGWHEDEAKHVQALERRYIQLMQHLQTTGHLGAPLSSPSTALQSAPVMQIPSSVGAQVATVAQYPRAIEQDTAWHNVASQIQNAADQDQRLCCPLCGGQYASANDWAEHTRRHCCRTQ